MTSAEIQERVRQHLVSSYLPGEQAAELRNDADLLDVLNSLQLLRMVMEIEQMFAIAVENSELSPENLGTIEDITAFVQRKTA